MSLQERWYEEVWNQGSESAIDELLHPQIEIHGLVGPDGKELDGIAAFKAYHRMLITGLSNLHVTLEQLITQGDLSAARCLVTANHTGEGLGKPPKGNPIRFTGISMCRELDGKMIEAWNHFDFATMMQQME